MTEGRQLQVVKVKEAAKKPQSVLQRAKAFAGKNRAALIANGIGAAALGAGIPLAYGAGKRNERQKQ